VEIIGVFPFMLSLVEAFIGFFSRIAVQFPVACCDEDFLVSEPVSDFANLKHSAGKLLLNVAVSFRLGVGVDLPNLR